MTHTKQRTDVFDTICSVFNQAAFYKMNVLAHAPWPTEFAIVIIWQLLNPFFFSLTPLLPTRELYPLHLTLQ